MPLAIFNLTILLGAFQIFIVQPMASKYALPVLGGAPFVWNGCMVFFQFVLLLGYLYAHGLTRMVPIRKQPAVHIGVLLLGLLVFPLSFAGLSSIDPATSPRLWLMAMLTFSVGLPFLALSATSPLTQAWFSAATQGQNRNPYALYAASNIGSFAALLAYPALVEPYFPLAQQSQLLMFGYIALIACFIGSGVALLKSGVRATEVRVLRGTPPNGRLIATWIILAFVPSSLLYGVTSYITTDIASAPLFWVLPLGIYLLTFIITFSNRPIGVGLARFIHPAGAAVVALITSCPQEFGAFLILLHLVVFFCAAMACHARLSELKPDPSRLTGFYLWVSLGGVLGGLFNTFVAPSVFRGIIEYPLMLLVSLVVVAPPQHLPRPSRKFIRWTLFLTFCTIVLGFLLMSVVDTVFKDSMEMRTHMRRSILVILFSVSAILMGLGWIRYSTKRLHYLMLTASLVAIISILYTPLLGMRVARAERNVFGVSRVIWDARKDVWEFRHGTTNHGIQSTDEQYRLKPVAYYTPLKDVFAALPPQLAQEPLAVMGMGAGLVACYGKKDQDFMFMEIDPMVDEIARDTRFFTYLRDCPPNIRVVIGDGRISLSKEPQQHFGFIVLDAFSSDAIPMHLISEEAVAMYFSKLKEGGMLAFNISNRHVDLIPVLSAIAEAEGAVGAWRIHIPSADDKLALASQWIVLARDEKSLDPLLKPKGEWTKLPAAEKRFLWRDDYSNILSSLRMFQKQEPEGQSEKENPPKENPPE